MDQDNANDVNYCCNMPILRNSSIEDFINGFTIKEPLGYCGDVEIANNDLGMVQSYGVNHQAEIIVDTGSVLAPSTSSGGYCAYNDGLLFFPSGGNLTLDYMTSQVGFGIQHAPINITQAPILQSQSFVDNNNELIAYDASIPNIGISGKCITEDIINLPTYAHGDGRNDKQEETSTSNKQILVVGPAVTNESLELSNKERKKLYNRKAAERSREKKKIYLENLEAMEKIFNKVKPFLSEILNTDDESSLIESCILLREKLQKFIAKNKFAASMLGILTRPESSQTDRRVGVKIGRSPSMVRVASCERLCKGNPGKRVMKI